MASKDLPPPTASIGRHLLHSQLFTKPKPPPRTTTLVGKTALVTGSNVGLGLECARQFLRLEVAHLILGVRSIEKGEQAAITLRKAHPKAEIEVWHLDMLSYESIQGFVKQCQGLIRLDIAVLNAGLSTEQFVINPSTGHEEITQVNYLSTALLSILLLPSLSRSEAHGSGPGRLTLISSGTALSARFPGLKTTPFLSSFDAGKGWDSSAAMNRYGVSKALLLMFVSKISEFVDPNKVVINAVCPGFIQGTQLHRHLGSGLRAMVSVMKTLTARSLDQGVWAYVDAAVAKGKETHGCFLLDCKISPFHAQMYTDEGKQATDKLWQETLDEFGFVQARELVETGLYMT